MSYIPNFKLRFLHELIKHTGLLIKHTGLLSRHSRARTCAFSRNKRTVLRIKNFANDGRTRISAVLAACMDNMEDARIFASHNFTRHFLGREPAPNRRRLIPGSPAFYAGRDIKYIYRAFFAFTVEAPLAYLR